MEATAEKRSRERDSLIDGLERELARCKSENNRRSEELTLVKNERDTMEATAEKRSRERDSLVDGLERELASCKSDCNNMSSSLWLKLEFLRDMNAKLVRGSQENDDEEREIRVMRERKDEVLSKVETEKNRLMSEINSINIWCALQYEKLKETTSECAVEEMKKGYDLLVQEARLEAKFNQVLAIHKIMQHHPIEKRQTHWLELEASKKIVQGEDLKEQHDITESAMETIPLDQSPTPTMALTPTMAQDNCCDGFEGRLRWCANQLRLSLFSLIMLHVVCVGGAGFCFMQIRESSRSKRSVILAVHFLYGAAMVRLAQVWRRKWHREAVECEVRFKASLQVLCVVAGLAVLAGFALLSKFVEEYEHWNGYAVAFYLLCYLDVAALSKVIGKKDFLGGADALLAMSMMMLLVLNIGGKDSPGWKVLYFAIAFVLVIYKEAEPPEVKAESPEHANEE